MMMESELPEVLIDGNTISKASDTKPLDVSTAPIGTDATIDLFFQH